MLSCTIDPINSIQIDRLTRDCWRVPAEILSRPRIRDGLRAIPSGLGSIDLFLEGGFVPGGLTTIVARTGGCKSQLAANICRTASGASQLPLLLTLEDDEETVVLRLLAQHSAVPFNKLRRGVHDLGNDSGRVLQAMSRVSVLSVRIASTRDLEEIIELIGRHAKENGNLVLIDYLGCVNLDSMAGDPTEYYRISAVMRRLEFAAREYSIPVIIFCQANRQGLLSWEPLELWHIRDSGFIEQLSTLVMSIERGTELPGVQPGDLPRPHFYLPLRVLKNRWGRTHAPIDHDIEPGSGRAKQVQKKMQTLAYDCMRLMWYPVIHLIEDDPTLNLRNNCQGAFATSKEVKNA